MQISIVTTVYKSAPFLKEFYERSTEAVKQITTDYEIIIVNDGSPDESAQIAIDLHKQDFRLKVIDLSRNFGHHKAIMTGLAHARGEHVFLIDSDLEENPELLLQFYEELNRTPGLDVVYGVQKKRREAVWDRVPAYIFYRVINFLSRDPVPTNLMTVRLMTRRYVENLVAHKDKEIFLAGLWVITGFKQKSIEVDKSRKNSTTYTLAHKMSNFINAITAFTNKPLIAIFYLGSSIIGVSLVYILLLIFRKAVLNRPPEGYSSLIVSIWFLGGLTIFCLGIIGIYISRIFTETKDRPYTVIKDIYGD